MGLRYRKSVKILPGVKLNFSKSGMSTTIGKKGMCANISDRGVRTSVGIPGTGLSYISNSKKSRIPKVKSLQDYNITPPVSNIHYAHKDSYTDAKRRNANTAMWGCSSLLLGIFLFLGFLIIGHDVVLAFGSLGVFGMIYYFLTLR